MVMRLSQLTKAKAEELGAAFKGLLKADSKKELSLASLAMDTAIPYDTITLSQKIPIPDTVTLPFHAMMRINDDIPTGKKEDIAMSPLSDRTQDDGFSPRKSFEEALSHSK
ncbi:hypothetical protein PRIPAC_85404 [Pristionchus pacificus]|uniref:Uncharacterized protein n=1 Tax=Pristionchus pacificus TaxID=54126 RepID=A0A454XUL6_PRIPA|nr:hypothetical protein PRIPAC_85404 [Pristionchus pacificus]|eukprot:PDM69763.1 hypothetical protein PRIPAC_44859 [Pristionchus pacificus]